MCIERSRRSDASESDEEFIDPGLLKVIVRAVQITGGELRFEYMVNLFGFLPTSWWRLGAARGRENTAGRYCSFAYSALACLYMGISESASFQDVTKSL